MKKLIGKPLLACLLLTICISFAHAQIWEREYVDQTLGGIDLLELPNEDLISLEYEILRSVDKYGTQNWTLDLRSAPAAPMNGLDIALDTLGNIAVIGLDSAFGPQSYLLKVSPAGNVLGQTVTEFRTQATIDFIAMPNGNYAALASDGSQQRLIHFDSAGDTIWTRTFTQVGNVYHSATSLIQTKDGNLLVVGDRQDTTTGSQVFVRKYLLDGTEAWNHVYLSDAIVFAQAKDIVEAPDSTLRLLVNTTLLVSPDEFPMIYQLNSAGDSLEVDTLSFGTLAKAFPANDSSGFYTFRRNIFFQTGSAGLQMMKFDWDVNRQWTRNYLPNNRRLAIGEVIHLRNRGLAASGKTLTTGLVANTIGSYLTRMDSIGRNFENLLIGRAYYDLNSNCVPDPGESNVPGLAMQINGDSTLVFTTDSDGNIYQPLNSGSYTVNSVSNYNYWAPGNCASNTNVVFPAIGDTVIVEFPLEPNIICPDLRVDIAASPLVICFESFYQVTYENIGTDTAHNAFVQVIMPPSVSVDSTTLPIAFNVDSLYRFSLGDIPPLNQGSFRLYVTVDCPGNPLDLLGVTECAIAAIYPDSNCLPTNTGWGRFQRGSGIDLPSKRFTAFCGTQFRQFQHEQSRQLRGPGRQYHAHQQSLSAHGQRLGGILSGRQWSDLDTDR